MRIPLTLSVFTVAAVTAALAGCVPDKPGLATDWLASQKGVVATAVLADHSDAFQSTGIVRGELAPELDDVGIAALVDSVQGYLADHTGVGVRLGRDGVDFVVSDDAETTASIELWKRVSGTDSIVTAVAWGTDLHARTLRVDGVTALADLEPLGAVLELESFRTLDDLTFDTEQDDFFGSDIENRLALAVHRSPSCDPPAAEHALAERIIQRDDVDGAQLRLCEDFDVYFAAAASLAQVVPDLRAQLEESGLAEFPVWARQQFDAFPDGRSVAVTPGEATLLSVIDVFESEGATGDYFELDPDRTLTVTEYSTTLADLLALVSRSPVAAQLPWIVILGTDATISGTLADLPAMQSQAVTLASSSSQYGGVELSPTTGSVVLTSAVATGPDVATAVSDLRASGAWQGRTFTVIYLSTQLTITDGVAVIGDPNYTDGHVVQAFVDAWNAGG